MRSILLHVHDDDCLEARLQVALDLVRQFDGHLTCMQVVEYEFGIPTDFYGITAAQMAASFRETADQVQTELEKRLLAEDVRWDWVRRDGGTARQIVRYAPLNDLLVLGAHNPAGKPNRPSTLVSELALDVRLPVLVVPASAKGFSLEAPALIAWNGSAESAHALRAAMPMLVRSSEVHVLNVRERKDTAPQDMPPTNAAKYLARHGIEANIVELRTDEDLSVADALVSAAQARKGAYIVMGAYGHSRMRERILGGVTHDMLSDPGIPLLLSH